MKGHLIRNFNFLLIALMGISFSCEKVEIDYTNIEIVSKSQEIPGYLYKVNGNQEDSTAIIPCKLYVRGGAPDHDKGDYHFKIAQGFVLPGGLVLDSLTGVIGHGDESISTEAGNYEFAVEVSDGIKTTISGCVLKVRYPEPGRFTLPAFQFSSPETNFISNKGSEYFAVSFGVMGGVPPYSFSVAKKQKLPGKLSLNPLTGVIAGNISKLDYGQYPFTIECTDATGAKAISFCTAQNHEDFVLIIK